MAQSRGHKRHKRAAKLCQSRVDLTAVSDYTDAITADSALFLAAHDDDHHHGMLIAMQATATFVPDVLASLHRSRARRAARQQQKHAADCVACRRRRCRRRGSDWDTRKGRPPADGPTPRVAAVHSSLVPPLQRVRLPACRSLRQSPRAGAVLHVDFAGRAGDAGSDR